jgi:hypothetical protein
VMNAARPSATAVDPWPINVVLNWASALQK